MINIINRKIKICYVLLSLAIILGIGLRFSGLNRSGIFFYDEALYFNHSLPLLELIERVHPTGTAFWQAVGAYAKTALNFTKPIWILIIDSRVFFTQVHDLDYPKYAACLFGVLTLPVAFIFARRLFCSLPVACLSTAILALLPGHVFYSRIGLQESFSTLVVLAGFYCYLFPREFGWKTFWAGLFLVMAYLANYRLIILPVLLVATELWFGVVCKEGLRWRHLLGACVTFFAVMLVVGSLMDGANGKFVMAWVLHQGEMAPATRMWGEILAYPYYLLRLESWVLTGAFFSSIYFVFKQERRLAWPLMIVCLQMLIFTLATDRGARYIAIVLPFMVMGASALIARVYHDRSDIKQKVLIIALVALMLVGLVFKSAQLVAGSSGHKAAVEYLQMREAGGKFLSTQDNVQKLYVQDRKRVAGAPGDFLVLSRYYAQGYRYLLLDPQAYIAFSANEYKWGLPLKDYLGYVDQHVRPLAVFAHFNRAIMERVVFEHSDDLFQSIRFLDSEDLERRASLRIYDLGTLVPSLSDIIRRQKH